MQRKVKLTSDPNEKPNSETVKIQNIIKDFLKSKEGKALIREILQELNTEEKT